MSRKIDRFMYASIYNGCETMRINDVTVVGIIDNPYVDKEDNNKWCQFSYNRDQFANYIHCPTNLSESLIDPDLVEMNAKGDLVYRIHYDVRGNTVAGMWYFEKSRSN